jgi:hypothetical protein
MASTAGPGSTQVSRSGLAILAERLWTVPFARSVLLYVLVILLLLLASRIPNADESPLAAFERASIDVQMRFLRNRFPRPLANDVVLIGIDEGSEAVFTEPLALWHAHFARLLLALKEAASTSSRPSVPTTISCPGSISPSSGRSGKRARRPRWSSRSRWIAKGGRPGSIRPSSACWERRDSGWTSS